MTVPPNQALHLTAAACSGYELQIDVRALRGDRRKESLILARSLVH